MLTTNNLAWEQVEVSRHVLRQARDFSDKVTPIGRGAIAMGRLALYNGLNREELLGDFPVEPAKVRSAEELERSAGEALVAMAMLLSSPEDRFGAGWKSHLAPLSRCGFIAEDATYVWTVHDSVQRGVWSVQFGLTDCPLGGLVFSEDGLLREARPPIGMLPDDH